MILINNEIWVNTYDLDDISNIIRDHYNPDLADAMDKLIPQHTDEEYNELENTVNEQEIEIDSMEIEISNLESEIDRLQEQIDELQSELENYEQE